MLEILVFSFFMELGWINNPSVILPEKPQTVENLLYMDIEMYLQLYVVWAEVGTTFYSWPTGNDLASLGFYPARYDLRYAFGLVYAPFRVGIRFLHPFLEDPAGVLGPIPKPSSELFLKVGLELHKNRGN